MDWINDEYQCRRNGVTRRLMQMQMQHTAVNARYPGCTLEYCCECGQPTGNAGYGDGSLYTDDEEGPFCAVCFETTKNEVTSGDDAVQRSWHPREAPYYVAALFVQPDGCYSQVPWVDMWPENRDARNYMGPLPVVAHPPCRLWGPMAVVNYARWSGEHNRPGNDGGCFAAALSAVNCWGGVLEHPAKTRAWPAHGLEKPIGMGGWQRSGKGWVCEVWQSVYGHRANKATWLYYCGVQPPFDLRWDRPKGTHQIGFHDQRGKAANKPTLGKREANATPIEFRDELLKLAMICHVVP